MTDGHAGSALSSGDGRRERVATRIVFFLAGAGMSAWAPLVPYAKVRIGATEGGFGLVLLGLGAGSIVAMPLAGAVVARHGCRVVIVGAAATLLIALIALSVAPTAATVALTLVAFGAGLGAVDVAMNLQAIAVERAAGRTLMSGFHGLFSIGGIAGAAAMSVLLAADVRPWIAATGIAVALTSALAVATPGLLSRAAAPGARAFARPHGVVLLIGALCAAAFLVEGAVLDWSAILLSSSRGLAVAQAGIGYAAFSVAMTIVRLAGDRIVRRLGPRAVLTTGALVSGSGALVVALSSAWPATVAGFALIGIGSANIAPILFSAAGRQTAMPEAIAVPAATTLGYFGLLAGPVAVGAVAHATSLSVSFGLLALLMAGVAVAGRTLRS